MKIGLWLLIFLFLFASQSDASLISMGVTVSNTLALDGSSGESTVSVTNGGDEAAYNVQVSLLDLLNNNLMAGQIYSVLKPEEKTKSTFKLDLSNITLPGTYPLLAIVDYRDANNYPFSAIAYSTFNYKEATNPLLMMRLSPLKLADKATLSLDLTNLNDGPRKIAIYAITPRELIVKDNRQVIELAGQKSTTLTFKISSLSAIAGSNYPIFIVATYEDGRKFYSNFASSSVEIVKPEKRAVTRLPVFLGVGAVVILVLLIIILQFRKRKDSL